MLKLMLAACCVVPLTACATSTRLMPISPEIPPPPAAAGEPCRPTAQHRQADGSASAADDDATIRDGRFDLADCEAKRRLLWDAWPKTVSPRRGVEGRETPSNGR